MNKPYNNDDGEDDVNWTATAEDIVDEYLEALDEKLKNEKDD